MNHGDTEDTEMNGRIHRMESLFPLCDLRASVVQT